jgi:hypothetical protein
VDTSKVSRKHCISCMAFSWLNFMPPTRGDNKQLQYGCQGIGSNCDAIRVRGSRFPQAAGDSRPAQEEAKIENVTDGVVAIELLGRAAADRRSCPPLC